MLYFGTLIRLQRMQPEKAWEGWETIQWSVESYRLLASNTTKRYEGSVDPLTYKHMT